MDEKISYLAFESSQARMERINVRLWVTVIVLITALLGTNAGWIYYESSYKTTNTITQEANSDRNSDISMQSVGGDYYNSSEAR